jgi:toxin CcdB
MPTALCPIATIKGNRFHALAHFAAPLPAKSLKRPLATVGSQADVLVSAVDTVISGF